MTDSDAVAGNDMGKIRDQFVELVKHELSSRGWSQSELARRMNVDRGQVSKYLSGQINAGPAVMQSFFTPMGLTLHLSFDRVSDDL